MQIDQEKVREAHGRIQESQEQIDRINQDISKSSLERVHEGFGEKYSLEWNNYIQADRILQEVISSCGKELYSTFVDPIADALNDYAGLDREEAALIAQQKEPGKADG